MSKLYRVKLFTFNKGWTTIAHEVTKDTATILAEAWEEALGSENVEVHEYDAANI